MPAIYTHYTFANDVFNGLEKDIKNKFEDVKDIYYLFAQSFDILFFKNRALGTYAHNNNVNLYFKNIISYLMENNLQNESDVLAYLYGSITHYVLDSIVHPLVYYRTGRYYQNNKDTFKYKGMHAYMEHHIDAIIYEDRNKKGIYSAKFDREVLKKLKFSKKLNEIIDYAFFHTFDVVNTSKLFYRGYRNYRFILKHVNISRFGIKYAIFKLVDNFTWLKWKPSSYCYYIKNPDKSVLNMERNEWCYPVDEKRVFHYSFYDLYDIAIEKAKKIIGALDLMFSGNLKVDEVLELIGNDSYYTGVDASLHGQMKYFLF